MTVEDILKTAEIIRSRRKTIELSIQASGRIIIRVPLRMSKNQIADFISKRLLWIEKNLEKARKTAEANGTSEPFTKSEIKELADKAAQIIPEKAAHFAKLIGVEYGKITIRCQRTRWGSCTAKGNLNFNCLLMLVPEKVMDSIIVHELCHRKEMNHSKRFYDEVLRVMPDYYEHNLWLKENGSALISRIPIGGSE